LDDRRAAGDGAEARRLLPAARALAAPFAGERLEAPVRGARLGGRRAGQRHPQEDERVQHALGAPPTRKGCRATAPGRRRTWAYTARIMKAGRLPITDAMFLYGEDRDTMLHVASLMPFTPPPDAAPDALRRLVDELRATHDLKPPWNLKLR